MIKRTDVEFFSEGQTCRAWLYMPETSEKPPVIVMGTADIFLAAL